MTKRVLPNLLLLAAAAVTAAPAAAEVVGMYGNTPSRNMVSPETGLPAEWNLETGQNLLWTVPLGSQSYGGPVVAGDQIYVGTNNEGLRNPKLTGDRGNMMAFDKKTGEFLWQSAHTKLPAGRVHDWPLQGVCSGPYIEGDRIYYVSNQAELIAADTQGFRDGENDGPYKDEENTSELDEDVVWKLDMIDELDVFPHNLAVGSPLIVGDLLFTVTGNGVDEGHINIPSPLAPSFIAVNKKTGELVWENDAPDGKILHGQWSNPTYGKAGGREQIVFPGGDGWLYSFEPETGKEIWRFDANPKDSVWELGGAGTRNNIISTPVFYKDRVYIGVGQDPEHGEGVGNFWVIDATKTGDVTGTGVVWHRGGEEFRRTISTAAIADGIVYIADLSGFLYALDAETGEHYWTYDTFAAVWGSAFVADGKVYLGDEDGEVVVIRAGKGKGGEPEVLAEHALGSAVYTTPVASDGVLYIASRNRLYAFKEGARSAPSR
ncbi:MAG: PQQ-binding-like beta-propeller repeat protein [Thermoanaerobaculia bacterium]|nr:PQQ-binding-like beta-propeller repeat protein [Thermoanaerobaculia bacterium]